MRNRMVKLVKRCDKVLIGICKTFAEIFLEVNCHYNDRILTKNNHGGYNDDRKNKKSNHKLCGG